MTKRELSRQTPDCIGAKLLITSTSLRAYRNRHLGTSCDVVKLGNLLKTPLIRLPLSVLISSDSPKLLQILLVKLLRNVRLITTLLWTQTEKDTALASCRGGHCAWRNKKPVLSLAKDFVSIGEPFSRHARKARGITSTKIFCDLFNKLLMTSIRLLIRLSSMTSLL